MEEFSNEFFGAEASAVFMYGYVAMDLRDIFSTYIDTTIAASQIWAMRPEGVREEL